MGAQNESNKIWFFWNSGTNVTIIVDHPQFLHVKVEDPKIARPIYFTPVYASCDASIRRDLWAGLHHISLDMDDPWIVGGDFNVITHDGERTGHNTHDRDTTAFSNMMLDSGLEDAGFLGHRYTWTNGRVRKRLDRVLINSSAAALCLQLTVKHLNRTSSNHSPLLLQWTSDDDLGPRPFRFLNVWTKHHDFLAFVSQKWSLPTHLTGMRVRDAEDRVDEAEIVFDSDPTPEHRDILHQVQAALNQTLSIEEGFWKQRAGSRWAGEVLATPADIQTSAIAFYLDLLSTPPQPLDPIRLDVIPRLLTEDDNLALNRSPLIHEEDVYRAVLDFFDGGHLPRGFATTSIVLLPKKSGFIPGRLIGDNVLLAQELLYSLDNREGGGKTMLKLDMAKAYDRMDWGFIYFVLEAFGFDQIWIDRIRQCILECRFSVLLNGCPCGFFPSSPGLR
ncbi:uncharacterized protein LOC111375048 [Olea europaea var. sylvestris]|uniref:uncharacterized protein LOC111375048 n=1 Tax=Olea europaea var. sylvestris TaxID=158386 RepID=UPI000C1D1743|nr:uncharacterized protein LOC111375048 [Olea europaea var. sylvestris]